VSRSKDKGTRAETAVVRYLAEEGAVQVERRALSGTQDRGDVAGIPGVVIEVKDVSRDGLPGWVDESEVERLNDRAALAFVWHKRRGKSAPAEWFVTMRGSQVVEILRALGYLPAKEAAE
jgi:Holliday junction resolvase